jgi:CysZ protein
MGSQDPRSSNSPFTGAAYLLRGFRLLLRPGVRRYVLAPLLVNVLVFGGLLYLAWSHLGNLRAYVEGWLPGWLDFLSWVLVPLLLALSLLVLFFGFSTVGNLLAAPFNGFLAEAVERSLTGAAPETAGGLLGVAREAARSLASQARKLGYLALRGVPLLGLFLVPGVNLAAPFLWLAFGAWMLAIEYGDYPMANHGLGFAEQRALLRRRRLLSLGFGGAASAALLVPGLNLAVIPAAVAGATALWVEQLAPLARGGARPGPEPPPGGAG